jgi:hypothetical protein
MLHTGKALNSIIRVLFFAIFIFTFHPNSLTLHKNLVLFYI